MNHFFKFIHGCKLLFGRFFFSYREIFSNCVCKSFQQSQSIKTVVWSVFTLIKFLLLKSSVKICTYWLSIQKQPSGGVFMRECSVSVQQIYEGAPVRRCDFSKATYAALWGSLFCVGVLLQFLFRICGTLFVGLHFLWDSFWVTVSF